MHTQVTLQLFLVLSSQPSDLRTMVIHSPTGIIIFIRELSFQCSKVSLVEADDHHIMVTG